MIANKYTYIEEAIIRCIGQARGQSFFPYRIKTYRGMTLYGEVTFGLEMIPEGTKTEKKS